jgi:threonine/homoserine/homoserine lactone efflux protein
VTITSALASFAVVAGLLTILPGLDTALVLRAALTQGRAVAFATGAGISSGSLTWGAASAIGVSALLTASQAAFTVLRIAGACYLLWLGATLLWRSRRSRRGRLGRSEAAEPSPAPAAELPAAPPPSLAAAWWRGLATNLLNPKVGVFYVVMIPQFLPAGAPHLLMGLLLAGVHAVEGMTWFAGLIVVATVARRRFVGSATAGRVTRVVDRVTGVVLIGFGLRLAAAP